MGTSFRGDKVGIFDDQVLDTLVELAPSTRRVAAAAVKVRGKEAASQWRGLVLLHECRGLGWIPDLELVDREWQACKAGAMTGWLDCIEAWARLAAMHDDLVAAAKRGPKIKTGKLGKTGKAGKTENRQTTGEKEKQP